MNQFADEEIRRSGRRSGDAAHFVMAHAHTAEASAAAFETVSAPSSTARSMDRESADIVAGRRRLRRAYSGGGRCAAAKRHAPSARRPG